MRETAPWKWHPRQLDVRFPKKNLRILRKRNTEIDPSRLSQQTRAAAPVVPVQTLRVQVSSEALQLLEKRVERKVRAFDVSDSVHVESSQNIDQRSPT